MWRLQSFHNQTNETLCEHFFNVRPSSTTLKALGGFDNYEVDRLLVLNYVSGSYYTWYLEEITPKPNMDDYCVGDVEGTKKAQKWMEFVDILSKITYKPGWYFRHGIDEGRMWVQVGVTKEAEISFDPIEGKKVPWRGAKHYLSLHMCRQEIVSTVLHAIERAEMHEVHEWFRYKGLSIYNPHIDPDVLVGIASKAKNFNVRKKRYDDGSEVIIFTVFALLC